MFLYVTGFLPEPSPDDSMKYQKFIEPQQEQFMFEIMNWASFGDGTDGEQEMTFVQVKRLLNS